MPQIPRNANTELDHPITIEELRNSVDKGKHHKSPGPDGICHEFNKHMWDFCKNDLLENINNMCMEVSVSNKKKYGHIVCLRKVGIPLCPENYRPLIILNTDYKLLTRI